MRTSSVKERDGEISLCVCTVSCILAYILYNFIFSSKLNSGIISQILCKPAYASSCLLTAPLLYHFNFTLACAHSQGISTANYTVSLGM